MEKNKTGKYLKYAIGEIILVMVGILLALQVNSWNNDRLEVKKEQLFLKNLENDFKTNLTELNSIYQRTFEAYMASAELLEAIKGDERLDPTEVDIFIGDIVNKISSLDLISGSIDEITNTGSLNIISDPELRKMISNWSYYEADTNDDIIIMTDYLFNFFIPSLNNRTNFRNSPLPDFIELDDEIPKITRSSFSVNYDTTVKTLEFENIVYNNALNYMYLLNQYKRLEDYLTNTLEHIEANIR